jgi:hypothetical protein
MFLPQTIMAGFQTFAAGDAATIDLGVIAGVLTAEATVLPEAVVRHVEFLARNDLATLLRMHEFLGATGHAAAFEHWRMTFGEAARTPGYELFVQLGLERLEQLEKALSPAAK